MTLANYKTHLPPHPTRIGAVRSTTSIRGLVVHTSEGGELATSAEALSGFISSPRTYFPDGRIQNTASYHAIADTDGIIVEVADNRIAFAAGGGNTDFLHICIPGKVSQTRAGWLDANTRPHIRRVAEYLVDKGTQYAIPLNKMSIEVVRDARARGYCGHNDISKAFGKSTHTDPEPNFPWDVLASDVRELTVVDSPVFDPNRSQYALWPVAAKPPITVMASGDVVRYAKGVLRDHVARFLRWFAAHPAYSWLWNTAMYQDPVTGITHSVNRQALMNLAAAVCEANDPNDPVYNRNLIDSMVLVQAVFSGVSAIDGRTILGMDVHGQIQPHEWVFIDSLADGQWN